MPLKVESREQKTVFWKEGLEGKGARLWLGHPVKCHLMSGLFLTSVGVPCSESPSLGHWAFMMSYGGKPLGDRSSYRQEEQVRLLLRVCTLGAGDVREGPQWHGISAHCFALDTDAYGNRPVAGSNQEQYSLPQGLEYLPLSGSVHSSREAESEEKDIEASVIKHPPLRRARPGVHLTRRPPVSILAWQETPGSLLSTEKAKQAKPQRPVGRVSLKDQLCLFRALILSFRTYPVLGDLGYFREV